MRKSFGSLAMFAAIRRASSLVMARGFKTGGRRKGSRNKKTLLLEQEVNGPKIAGDVNEDVSVLVGVAPSRELPDPGLQLRRIPFQCTETSRRVS